MGWVKAAWRNKRRACSRHHGCFISWLCLCFISASLRNIWMNTTYDSGTFLGKLTRMETWRSLCQTSGEPWCRCVPEIMVRVLLQQHTALRKPLCYTTATSQPCWWCPTSRLKAPTAKAEPSTDSNRSAETSNKYCRGHQGLSDLIIWNLEYHKNLEKSQRSAFCAGYNYLVLTIVISYCYEKVRVI